MGSLSDGFFMSPEHWRRIEELYHSAEACPPDQRQQFLEQACPDDAALRDEVASLLQHAPAEDQTETVRLAVRVKEGSTLGHYRIERRIGAGGMGEVFRAVDTRLQRNVAIKVSHGPFSLRFRREALVLSSLNHAHICTLFDVGPDFLVMELVEGETLQARLQRGALPLSEVTRLGAQIADALAEAHSKGVTHRDLKPGNVMVTPKGVKLLDFGLAALDGDALTKPGAVMGTPAYMAPEQFTGTDAGPQTDIYALGLLLHEMASGRRPMVQPGEPAVLANLAGPLPAIVERCLAEEPHARWRGAGEIRALLEVSEENSGLSRLPRVARSRRKLPWVGGAVAVAVAALALWMVNRPSGVARGPALEVDLAPPPNTGFRVAGNFDGGFALSPDGTMLAFVGRTSGVANLWVRRLDSHDARMLAGTDRAFYPFWSPDSKSIGFFTSGPAAVKRVDVDGGGLRTLASASDERAWTSGAGGAWAKNGTILIGSNIGGPMARISENGGQAVPLQLTGAGPHMLPDGKRFIYSATPHSNDSPLMIALVDGGAARQIGKAGLWPQYSAGHIVSFTNAGLVAQPFDLAKEVFTGEPFPVAEIAHLSFVTGGFRVSFSAAANGGLVYPPMMHVTNRLIWRDRAGKLLAEAGPPGVYSSPRISPDGKRIAYSRRESSNTDVWLADLENAAPVHFTSEPGIEMYPVWTPDGSTVTYVGEGGGTVRNLYSKPAAGGAARRLFESPLQHQAVGWSKDGAYLSYLHISRGAEVMVLPPEGKPYSLVGKWSATSGQFSPNAGTPKWIAYANDDTGGGRREVFVIPFVPGRVGDADRIQISDNGGSHERWRADGKVIFYHALDGTMMEVPVDGTGAAFQHQKPVPLFQSVVPQTRSPDYLYDVTADGQKFLIVEPVEKAETMPLTLLTDWRASLKK
jgi:Tol biopolymer transport system component/predicted Ser/Thr protein kinase